MHATRWGLALLLSVHAVGAAAEELASPGGEPVKLALSIDDVKALRTSASGETGLTLCPTAAKVLEELTRANTGRVSETRVDGGVVVRAWVQGTIGTGMVWFRADTAARLALVERIAAALARRSLRPAPGGCAPGR